MRQIECIMTRKEFEKEPKHEDANFIGENWQSIKIIYSDENKDIQIEVNKDNVVKEFEVYEYLRLYGIYIGLKATDEKTEVKQMASLLDGRAKMIQCIESIKRKTEGKELKKRYKFNGYIRTIDAHIQMSKSELENNLLQSQIATNRISRNTNTNIAIFTGIAGAYYLHEFLVFIFPDTCSYDKNSSVNIVTLIFILGFVLNILLRKGKKSKQRQESTPTP